MAGQAGWYRAPGEDGLLRYWNGTAWTEHRQPAPAAAPDPAPVAVQPVAVDPVAVVPVTPEPTVVDPIVSTPIEVAPIGSAPFDISPIAAAPIVSTPVEVAPFEVTPIASTPFEMTPTSSTPFDVTPIDATPLQAPAPQRHVATDPLVPQPTSVVAPAEPDWSMDQFEQQFEKHFGPTIDEPVSRWAPQPGADLSTSVQVPSAPEAIALPAAAPAAQPIALPAASIPATAQPAVAAQPEKTSAADAAFAASTATADVARVRRNRKRVMNPVRGMIGGLLFILVGGALIFLATTQNNAPSGELKANGIITSLGSPKVGCSPIARFAAAGGSYTTPIGASMSPCPVQLGQSVNVFYTAQHPGTTGEISTPSSISTIDWAVTGIGVILLIGSFIVFIARTGSVSKGVAVIRSSELDEVAAAQKRP